MDARSLRPSSRASARLVFALALVVAGIGLSAALTQAQDGNPHIPSYPGVVANAPLSDFPPVINGGWPDTSYAKYLGGTCEAPFRPLYDCSSFRLVYANSTPNETGEIKNTIFIRAALYIKRPNAPTIVRQVTFHNGETELTLTPESMAVSDIIPEYWRQSEKGTAFVRTFARVAQVGERIPLRASWQSLTGLAVRMATSATNAPDLTMISPEDERMTTAPLLGGGFTPIAVLGDAGRTATSVVIIGSSSVAYTDSYTALAAKRAGVPYLLLSAGATTAAEYNRSKLRPHLDGICSHALVYYGRNDIGYSLPRNPPARTILNRVEGDLSSLWQRLKVQGAWVGAMTITPRTFGTSFDSPDDQTPSSAEVPLRLPLNDWIRETVRRSDSPLDRVYEAADSVEFFVGGQRSNKWNFGLDRSGNRTGLTADGTHPNRAGNALLARLIADEDFSFHQADYVSATPADAFVRGDGSRIVLHFNHTKNLRLIVPANVPGFTATVNGTTRRVTQARQTNLKEIALTLSGAPIKQGDAVRLDYWPDPTHPIVDSSYLHNPVEAFSDFRVDNRMNIAAPLSRLALSSLQWARDAKYIKAQIQLANGGAADIEAARLTAAQLGGVRAKASLPLTLGVIPSGASVSLTLTWPVRESGTKTTLQISGEDAMGHFTSSARVTIP